MLRLKLRRTRWVVAGGALTVIGTVALLVFGRECGVCEAATSILLSGVVLGKCTLAVTPDANASNLPLTANGEQRIVVGTALQDCTGNRNYTITLTSTNCPAAPIGGKLVDPVSGDLLSYSVEFTNPPTGGSQTDVTGLIANSCTSQIGRAVTQGHVRAETSTLYLNYTGSQTLSAGTYQDTLILSMNMQ
jgi:hypothetical protein